MSTLEKDKQLLITLALIQKNLADLTEKVDKHSFVLFGNGIPDNSVLWSIKGLADKMEDIETQMKETCDEFKNQLNQVRTTTTTVTTQKQDELATISWSVVFKRMAIQAPWAIVAILTIILLHQPAGALVMAIIKFIGSLGI